MSEKNPADSTGFWNLRIPQVQELLKSHQAEKLDFVTSLFWVEEREQHDLGYIDPGIPTTIKTMGVNITTIVYLRVLIIQIGSTIILMVVEAQGRFGQIIRTSRNDFFWKGSGLVSGICLREIQVGEIL